MATQGVIQGLPLDLCLKFERKTYVGENGAPATTTVPVVHVEARIPMADVLAVAGDVAQRRLTVGVALAEQRKLLAAARAQTVDATEVEAEWPATTTQVVDDEREVDGASGGMRNG